MAACGTRGSTLELMSLISESALLANYCWPNHHSLTQTLMSPLLHEKYAHDNQKWTYCKWHQIFKDVIFCMLDSWVRFRVCAQVSTRGACRQFANPCPVFLITVTCARLDFPHFNLATSYPFEQSAKRLAVGSCHHATKSSVRDPCYQHKTKPPVRAWRAIKSPG